MFARRFFYSCAGLLCLALAYHVGAETARAQTKAAKASFDEVTAKRLVIADEDGKVRAVLGLVAGKPSLALSDTKSKTRVMCMVGTDDTPQLVLTDGKNARVLLGVDADGEGSIGLLDANGEPVWAAGN